MELRVLPPHYRDDALLCGHEDTAVNETDPPPSLSRRKRTHESNKISRLSGELETAELRGMARWGPSEKESLS